MRTQKNVRKGMNEFILVGLLLCGVSVPQTSAAAGGEARQSMGSGISAKRLLDYIKVLSSDEYGGRAPASKGEELTVKFLTQHFRELGLEPGNPNGTYLQKVPMVGITANPDAQLVITDPRTKKKMELKYGDEFVAWTKREKPEVNVNAGLVFVGYGIVAPEYHWDDYKGMNVKGKILVMLINDPPVPDPEDPTQLDPHEFKGKAMTYYGRWTYKYEIAAKKDAAGCLIIHQTDPAGYPWGVVKSSNTGEQFSLVTSDKGMSRSAFEGWMTQEKARELFAMEGKNLDELEKAAVRRDFRPVPLGAKASLTLRNKIRTIDSNNVVAKFEGTDPNLRDEYIIYTAHWDHLGTGEPVNGDRIYHGAKDNASGVAGLLELARAYTKVEPPPRRSILFLSVTAEEKGLLGSQYYAEHPLYPLNKTLAEINMDALNVLGPTKDIEIIGLGMSTLDDVVKAVAARQGRVVKADGEPEKGFYYRSDHFNFAKVGVPALDPSPGVDYIGKPAAWGMEMRRKFTTQDYHKPSDVVKPYWDLSGEVRDLQLLFEVGYDVANAKKYPTWKPGSEFRVRREAMMKKTKAIR